MIKATPGCSVRLGSAVSGEYPCNVPASKSGEGVHLEISGPTPLDLMPADPRPVIFSYIANLRQLPKTGPTATVIGITAAKHCTRRS